MVVQWSGLAEVAVVSIGATVAIVFVFALGVRALSSTSGEGTSDKKNGRPSLPLMGVAGLCFLACGAAVLYGLYLLVPQVH
jgi:hypothetical protein